MRSTSEMSRGSVDLPIKKFIFVGLELADMGIDVVAQYYSRVVAQYYSVVAQYHSAVAQYSNRLFSLHV